MKAQSLLPLRSALAVAAGAVALVGCSSDTTSPPPPGNQAPTAAVSIQGSPIPEGNPDMDVVTLDGSGSSDPDGDPLTYAWTAGTCQYVNGTSATSVEAQVLCDGGADVPVSLTVSDPDGLSGSANGLIEVEGMMPPPMAAGFHNLVADPELPVSAYNVGSQASPPDFIPAGLVAGYEPTDVSTFNGEGGFGIILPTDDDSGDPPRRLQATTYYGAVAPGTPLADAWYVGWTVWSTDGSDSRPAPVNPVVLTGTISADMTLTADTDWQLDGPVFVGEDCGPDPAAPSAECTPVTLTVEPGTTVYGKSPPSDPQARSSFLVVRRGSKIIADCCGTSRRPTEAETIVFTSSRPPGQRARADWGGIVINGRAPLNTGDEAVGEGDSGVYGGVHDEDNSGIIRGVRVEFAGDDLTATDQLNGIAWQGSGAGTTADYIQVHYNKDDGTEPFGGSTSQTHMVVSGIGDDGFDGTDGYRGFLQFGISQQRADDADQGFELSTNGDDGAAMPHSTAIVANVTAVGAGKVGQISNLGGESDIGLLQREGSNWRIYNTIITNFGDSGFCVEDGVTIQNANNRLAGQTDPSTTLSVESSIIWDNGPGAADGDGNFADACGDGYDNQGFWTYDGQ